MKQASVTNLLAHEQIVVVARVFVAQDAQLWRLHIRGVTGQVGELLAGFREEERGVLPRGNSKFERQLVPIILRVGTYWRT